MRYLQLIISISLLSCLLGGLMLFFQYQYHATEIIIDHQAPIAQAEELSIREYDEKSGCVFVLHAKNFTIPQQQQNILCNQATAYLINKDHHTTATLCIAQAHINRIHKMITCSHSITGSMHGMTLITTSCLYTFSSNILEIPGIFELRSEKARTIAPQATINLQTGTITCDKGIKTEITLQLQRSRRNNSR